MKRTYIDITQLVHWPGRLTGIPRVMNELSLRYAKDSTNIFVAWSKDDNCFYELDVNESLKRRGEGIFYKQDLQQNGNDSTAKLHYSINKKIVRSIKNTTVGLKNRNPVLYAKLASKINNQLKVTPSMKVRFGKNDSLFVLWGEWADKSYVAALKDAHEVGVSLLHIVYDILPVIAPQYSGHSTVAMDHYYREVIPLSDLVLCISESTKKDLAFWLTKLNINVPRIEAFRLGDDFTLSLPNKPTGDNFTKQLEPENYNYILCVGTIEARKNHTLLYYTYKLAIENGIKLPKIVVVGRRGWRTDDIFNIISDDPQVKDSFIFLSDISDEELSWLYQNCLFSIYPSFYEGWGLPIAESIAYGKPCISSNTSSMPEIAGNLIDYFSPYSAEQCLASINKLLSKKSLEDSKNRILDYKTTYWDDTYRQVASLIKEIYAQKN